MKHIFTVLLTLIFSISCIFFGAFQNVYAQSTDLPGFEFDPKFTANDLPQGGTPKNPKAYSTFSFDLKIPTVHYSSFYKIDVTLYGVSEHPGSAANFNHRHIPRGRDLRFHKADYPKGTNKWKYKNNKTLVFDSTSGDTLTPGAITIRCYDFGAYGHIQAVLKRKTSVFSWTTEGTATHPIPIDTNGNKIADGWENDATNNYSNAADDESVQQGRLAKGDGWSVFDEYRGFFISSTAGSIQRLNPTERDVMVCVESVFSTQGIGVPFHNFWTLDEKMVQSPWGNINKEKTGRVNINSTTVPGYKPVWAIRIVEDDTYDNSTVLGSTYRGSPSNTSKIVIYTGRMKRQVFLTFRKAGLTPDATSAEKKAGANFMLGYIFDHEVGHCLDQYHCQHTGCVMRRLLGFGAANRTIVTDVIENKKNKSYFHSGHDTIFTATGAPGSTKVECELCGVIHSNEDDGDDDQATSTSSPSLSPSNGVYTASTGDSHTANLSVPSGWTSIYWYLKSPSESGLGTSQSSVSDSTGNSTTASYTYMFPSGTSGDYVLTAYTTLSDNTVVQPSYTVSVSMSINVLSTPGATLACDITPPVPRDTGFTVTLTAVGPFRSASFYQQGPGSDSETFSGSEGFYDYPESGTTITHQLSFSGSQGAWKVRVEITPVTGNPYSVTFTIPTR